MSNCGWRSRGFEEQGKRSTVLYRTVCQSRGAYTVLFLAAKREPCFAMPRSFASLLCTHPRSLATSKMAQFIGSTISLVSKSDIRYIGKLEGKSTTLPCAWCCS